jgi:uncharacterized SAM-binding protein YcdF (DUF218 family)
MFLLFGLARRIIASAISFVILLGFVGVGYVVYYSKADQRETTDVIVVLGASQFDGEPSPVFANRLDHALELVMLDVASSVITVGGKQPGDRFTEASAGRQYLIASGLSPDQVFAVPTGSDTLSSLEAVAVQAKKRGFSRVTLVSDPAHMARVRFIAAGLGLEVFSSPTSSGAGTTVDLDYVVREVGGIAHYFLLDRWGI